MAHGHHQAQDHHDVERAHWYVHRTKKNSNHQTMSEVSTRTMHRINGTRGGIHQELCECTSGMKKMRRRLDTQKKSIAASSRWKRTPDVDWRWCVATPVPADPPSTNDGRRQRRQPATETREVSVRGGFEKYGVLRVHNAI